MKNPLETMQEMCHCGDRPREECPGEWEPNCDLGNNEKFASPYPAFENQTIIQKLRIRAEIRRNATSRKSVQENQPDRLADLLEEAADKISDLECRLTSAWVEDEIETHISSIIRGGQRLSDQQFDRLFDKLNDQMILNQLGKYVRSVDTTNGNGYAITCTDDLRAVVEQELYERLTGKS